jgi:hypothetical protein
LGLPVQLRNKPKKQQSIKFANAKEQTFQTQKSINLKIKGQNYGNLSPS